MLDRIHGEIFFECDTCGETLETETKDFAQARTLLAAEKWKVAKIGPDWYHECPACKDKPACGDL